MDFEWDEAKSRACFDQRGFDFAYAVRAFLDPTGRLEKDDRLDYGESRFRLTARIEGRLFLSSSILKEEASCG